MFIVLNGFLENMVKSKVYQFHYRKPSEALPAGLDACTPPRGWNSYDSFSWIISEEEFLANAKVIAKSLLAHGYKYVVVDFLWYRRNVKGSSVSSPGYDVIDEWGRVIPDPDRWPSSKGGKGFSEVAKQVHAMGLKFGINVMRGISTQAVNANTPILDIRKGGPYEESGKQFKAHDIGRGDRACSWMSKCFMLVDTNSEAGKAFLRSLYHQYAEWGVDFVKHDCIFGDDLDVDEIRTVSEILRELDRPIMYSISPGTRATPAMAKNVNSFVNMYRITGNDWDKWQDVEAHFDAARDFANAALLGARGLQGQSWPDLDMLPLAWLTDPGVKEGPHRLSNLSPDEQRTQVTLWSIAKSPLMFGGDARQIDTSTYNLITNPVLLEINSFSKNNMEFPSIFGTKVQSDKGFLPIQSTSLKNETVLDTAKDATLSDYVATNIARSWIAVGRKECLDFVGEIYLSFFNLSHDTMVIFTNIAEFRKWLPGRDWSNASCKSKEVFSGKDYGIAKTISQVVVTHSCALFVLNCY
ncbi:alpha-galactosidase-like [Telopea speciosissima]|uniref:alpha-galactosidase-like n=1 Tax=Telopea speciosissima TaxID=54955 RepID=UPI001CC5EA3B|nr:alpha-galactosidase-like [Telopea speciosissima]